ncbi:tyrosine-type recombinase/integrase [Parasporobacterium paucivorans]|uniref:Site-specific recombinase XerD n=1 Tax=Parasporobacterium paucivorans DSM 15970 TaxID=1122934 RepID=A0A1M6B891_9FIRM|nr:site-specific integrase [Parasporobacterium paucivorans]SHI44867.1 Site-specific recombinase XerD [Parasporobacterium paucivorans DSM 15970]
MAKAKEQKYTPRSDGRYHTRIRTGEHDDNGRAISIPLYAASSAKLEKLIIDTKVDLKNGTYKKPDEVTVESYAEKWLKTYKSNKSTNTKQMYAWIVKGHIIPKIGTKRLVDVTHSDIQWIINDMGSKRRTCEQIMLTLRQIIKAAIRDDIIKKSPCEDIELPAKTKSEKRALTDKEVEAMKKCDFTEKESAFVGLLYYFGLRREEVIALMRNDFDFEKKTLTISRAIVFDVNKAVVKDTKSQAGKRELVIPDAFLSEIQSYISTIDGLYLFTKSDGGLISKVAFRLLFDAIRNKINAKMGGNEKIKATDLTAYTFRHNYCTLLYYSGISTKKAAELMGHKDIQMIMRIYAHLDEQKEKTEEKINTMFDKKIAL